MWRWRTSSYALSAGERASFHPAAEFASVCGGSARAAKLFDPPAGCTRDPRTGMRCRRINRRFM